MFLIGSQIAPLNHTVSVDKMLLWCQTVHLLKVGCSSSHICFKLLGGAASLYESCSVNSCNKFATSE